MTQSLIERLKEIYRPAIDKIMLADTLEEMSIIAKEANDAADALRARAALEDKERG